MIVDTTITIGSIVEIAVIGIGWIGGVMALRSTVGVMKSDLTDVKTELRKLGEVVISLAVTNQRVSNTDKRVENLEQDVREMRHGKGFVQREIGGEWPR